MPVEPDPLAKSLADEMARQLSGDDGAAAVLLMQRFGMLALPERKPPAARQGTIGVWEVGPQGYQRAPALRQEWGFWASVESLPPKDKKKRVLLLGESAARGFLYDPEFNPAQALEASLTLSLGEAAEVIDLAKSDLRIQELQNLAGAALALEPDALVLFAGNNWFLRDARNRSLEATVLRESGVAGLKKLIEQRISGLVGTLREQFTQLSLRVPIVVVIPEINLADWRLDAEADAPWLPLGRNRRWLASRTAARSALAAGRLGEAETLAREMVELDEGTAASGWTLLADCAAARGDLAAARLGLEKARDSHTWDNTYQTPRTLSLIQEAIRAWVLPGRIAVVDLPRCFAAWQDGQLPGRRLFLDYCHLTSEGIRVAMAATASEVAALLDAERPHPSLESLAQAVPPLPPHLEAAAHFGAAIHGAHWGQSFPIVSFHCHEAARRSPEMAQAMRVYLEIQARQAPTWMCTEALRLSALATPFLRRYILRFQTKLFDPILLPAIAEALEKNGLPSVAVLDTLRQEAGLSDRPRDLLAPFHRESLADRDWLDWTGHFCRAHTLTSRYPWVSRSSCEVSFKLTCRQTPRVASEPGGPDEAGGTASPGECHLRVNGACVAHFSLTPEWSTVRFSAPAGLVRAGVNWLEIQWARDLPDGEKEVERIALDHERGLPFSLLPVFAEISSLHAVRR